MNDKRDPLLGLPMRFMEIGGSIGGSQDGEDEDDDYVKGDAHSEDQFHDETEDKLFPNDIAEDFTQIEASQSYNAPSMMSAIMQEDSPTLSGASFANSNLATPQHLFLTSDDGDLLPGEALQLKVTDAIFLPDRLVGTLLVTSYRLQFAPNGVHSSWRAPDYFKFPVTVIHKITRKSSAPMDELTIACKDGRQSLLLKFSSEHVARRAHSLLLTLAFPISQGVGYRWFFCFGQPVKTELKPLVELLAIPLPESCEESRFRETVVNWDFSMSPSYPKSFYVPKQVSDAHLRQVAQFRSKGRIPALCWFDRSQPNKGGTMWRCSQPKVGFAASFSLEDEALVEAIRRGTASGTIVIVDCRSAMAAMANKARGMGTEDVARYRGTKMQFENIANYHAIRNSFASLCKLMNKTMAKREDVVEESFAVELEGTKWLYHIKTIIAAAFKVAEAVAIQGHGVIVHCSDGWDRTSQLTALAQVLIDPEARTRKGFVKMVHREWILFGHKFRDRLGVGVDGDDSEERAPIFIQFLDCVWQLKRLFPKRFEFNERFLEMMAYHAYSSRFVEFMGNTANDWETALQGESGGSSLWELLLVDQRCESTFDESDTEYSAQGILLPKLSVVCRQVTLWDMFSRRSSVPSLGEQAFDVAHADSESWEWWM